MKINVKNTMSKVMAILFVLALVTCCVMGNTLAKYASSYTSGSGSATVAKWSWKINDAAAAASFTFNPFATINEADGTTTESDVSSGKIAPGVGGTVQIKVENLSEVKGKYTITLNETNASSIPMEYSIDGTNYESVTDFNTSAHGANLAVSASATTVTIYWRWAFDGTDTTDTALGTATTAPTVAVTATVAFEQVD